VKNTIYILPILLCLACAQNPVAPARDYAPFNQEALTFCQKNNFQQDYYFLIDMRIHSGKNRFFVYSFAQNKNLYEKLVTHGSCNVFQKNTDSHGSPQFSNQPDSHCSSLGKYKVYKRDYSQWGINIKYWLKGLETSNNKAEDRVVVLHSWGLVPDTEIFPEHTVLSWGCPAVSDAFMTTLDNMLKNNSKPTLLWIIN